MKQFIILITSAIYLYAAASDNIWRASALATIATFYVANIPKANQGSIIFAQDNEVTLAGLDIKWHKKDIGKIGNGVLKYYNQISYETWDNNKKSTQHYRNNVINYNPLFKLVFNNTFIDYSMGISLMSHGIEKMLDEKYTNGKFAFNHILALGINFKNTYISASFKHYSNNGIYRKNTGANFIAINIGHTY